MIQPQHKPIFSLKLQLVTEKMKTTKIFQRCKISFFVAVIIFQLTTPCLAAYNVWLDNTLTKYRQGGEDGISGSPTLLMEMAKNEFESFQVMIYADGETLSNVDVSVSNLVKGSDTIDDIYLYKQHYVNCVNQSRVEYPTGWYPDALLPKVDRYFHETRNTFPFTVEAGKIQGVWVDIGTTSTTPAGSYTGIVTVTAQGKDPIQHAVTIIVWDFALPSTSTFRSSFVFRESYATYGHGLGQNAGWSGTQAAIDLSKTYKKAFLYHRIGSVFAEGRAMNGADKLPWDSATKTLRAANWEPWYTIHKDAMSGTAITSGPYAGAKQNTVHTPASWPADSSARTDIAIEDKETAARQYLQLVWDKMTSEGWNPMTTLYVNTKDEPRCDQTSTWRGITMSNCNVVIDQAQDAAAINTGGLGTFKNVYTNSKMRAGLEGFATYGLYSANTYSFVCPGWDNACTSGGTKISRDTYPGYPNGEIWGYLACDNNACWQTGASWLSGQVDWSADARALYNRLPGFIWAKYEVTGTVYWGTNQVNIQGGADPYNSIWYFGSNGDGHLLYPGVANRTGRMLPANTPSIGGTHDIPIESIRFKHIRDAIEDWEYVQLAKAKVGKVATFAVLDQAFTNANIDNAYWNLNMDGGNFLATRRALTNLILNTKPSPIIKTINN